ncbi:MAG: hypothetical protein IK119_08490, partial [Bacteroidales bacterium]|nr:hypothetical protein [Bacteroidales bacterium]
CSYNRQRGWYIARRINTKCINTKRIYSGSTGPNGNDSRDKDGEDAGQKRGIAHSRYSGSNRLNAEKGSSQTGSNACGR